jgi:integrase
MTDGLPAITTIEEDALPAYVVESAKDFMHEARAANTRAAYGTAWRLFSAWCADNGRTALPASPETVVGWITCLALGADGRKPRSRGTIAVYLSGVITAQRTAGYEFNTKHGALVEAWRGISRNKARTEIERKAKPLLGRDLQRLLEGLDPSNLLDVRDGAMIALGWSGALRRSELVGLDWETVGDGTGCLRIEEREEQRGAERVVVRGLVITLARSKAAQENAVSIIIPGDDMPTAMEWVERWIAVSQVRPGQPIFRSIARVKGGRHRIVDERLGGKSVSSTLKKRVRELAIASGKSRTEAEGLVKRFTAHALRAGFITTAANNDLSLHEIAKHSRHRTLDVVAGYVREADGWKRSALKSIGF